MNNAEREAFERAIAADRYDQDTRRVFADWLDENGFDDEAAFQREWTPRWQEAEDWLKGFAERIAGYDWRDDGMTLHAPTLEQVVEAGRKCLDDNESSLLGGDGFGATNIWDEVREEYWSHWKAYTRRAEVVTPNGDVFRCCY